MNTQLSESSNHMSKELFDLADQQAGYFTAMQARKLGYSYPNQSYHRKQKHWEDMGWGLFRLRNYPQTDNELWVRLSLWSRNKAGQPQAVVSHESAISIYELSDLMPAKTHLTVPKSFRKLAPKGVILHKSMLSTKDIEQLQGFQITTPLRTLIDIANSNISPEHLEQASLQALERGLLRRSKLQAALQNSAKNIQKSFAYIGLYEL